MDKRPLGITLIAGIITFIGGLASVIMFVAIIDSLNIFGFMSVMICSEESLWGFFLYGCLPAVYYSTGVGLFLSRPWARTSLLFVIPAVSFIFMFHVACSIVRAQTHMYNAMFVELLFADFGVFFNVFWRSAVVMGPVVMYARRPDIRIYFETVALRKRIQ